MKNLRPFEIGLLAFFGILAVVGVILLKTFSGGAGSSASQYGSEVVVWGTLDERAMDDVFDVIVDNDQAFRAVSYFKIDEASFEERLVNAIAEGRSPDLILIPHEQIVRLRPKLLAIPYETLSERTFQDSYIDGAKIFAFQDGVYALPLGVDPLVMYWNRDLFSGAGIAQPPSTWEDVVYTVVPKLTVRDANRTILKSAIAFGEYRNVRNAGAILSMLTLQSGARMVEEGGRGYIVALNDLPSGVSGRPPFESATQFFTDFSNASNALYSWNRSQSEDRSLFTAGDLALYFGFGSEAGLIADRNPNLNFDIAAVPQGGQATSLRDYGRFYGLAIPSGAVNRNGGYAAATVMSSPAYAPLFAQALDIAPVHRAVLAQGSSNAFQSVIYNAALISRGWLTPGTAQVDGILQTMVEDIVSNRARLSEAVADAVDKITLVF